CSRVSVSPDLPAPAMAWRADDALALHPLHQVGRAVVADGEAPLEVAGRGLLLVDDDAHCAIVKAVVPGPSVPGGFDILGYLADARDVLRLSLLAQVGGNPLHLIVGDEWPMHAERAAGAVGEQHVAFAQKVLRTLLVEDG